MNIFKAIKDRLVNSQRSKLIATIAIIFSLLYHVSFLFIFRILGVMPMFYYNFFSVAVFTFCLCFIKKVHTVEKLILLAYIEVVIHQFLADYYLGGDSGFHFFILLIGIIPFLTLNHRFGKAFVYGILSSIMFTGLEVFGEKHDGIYQIPEKIVTTIKIVNVSLTALVIVAALLIYAFIVWHMEKNLKNEVEEKTLEAYLQNRKRVKLQNNIINSLASLVENRDTDTGEHIQRTSAYVEIIAKNAMSKGIYPEVITSDFVDLIKRAAPMHDIGKIVVPDSVLKKPGKLTDEEFEQMKLHTTQGGRIINEVIGISEDIHYIRIASDVACGHHERWDGKGYPYGLKGEEIPVSARIMALADVFDALVSPRCYKTPMTKEVAFGIIQEEAGSHFDPYLVDVFLDSKSEVERVLKRYTK